MNKITLTVVALLVCLSVYVIWSDTDSSDAGSEYSDYCGDNVKYVFDPDSGKLSITGSGEMYNYSVYTAPWYSYKEKITSVDMSESITSIGSYSFYDCTSLTSITIPSSITSLGEAAFWKCASLASITLPSNLTTIGGTAFQLCSSLTTMTIPDSVTTIERSTFESCSSLTSITLGNSTTTINYNAFSNCTSLSSITIPKSVTYLSEDILNGCTALTFIGVDADNANYCSENGVLFNKAMTELIQYPLGNDDTTYAIPDSVTSIGTSAFCDCSSLSSLIIPDSVTNIGTCAFMYCTSLTSITVGNSLTTIYHSAFYGCASLTSITIPKSVTTIGDATFYGCTALETIDVDTDNVNYCSVDGVLFNIDKTELIQYPARKTGDTYAVPGSVTTIGDAAFYCCVFLKSISVPDENKNYRSVDGVLFDKETTRLIQYPAGKTDDAYTIPGSVTTLGNYAFSYCTSLKSLVIPKSVTTLGDSVFNGCIALETIDVDADNVNYCSENGVLFDTGMYELILYPAGKTDATYTIPRSVVSIESYAFHGCTHLTSVAFGDAVTYIETSAFDGEFYDVGGETKLVPIAKNLAGFTFKMIEGKWVKQISGMCGDNIHYVFDPDTGALTVTGSGSMYNYPDHITVPWYSYLENIKSIYIIGDVTTLGAYAFHGCSELTSLNIPNSISSIGDHAFCNCSSLIFLTIPVSVTSIGDNAFDGEFYGIDGRSKLEPTSQNLAGSTFKKFDDNWFKLDSGQCGEKVYYEFDSSSGKLTITGSGPMFNYSEHAMAPWYSYKENITSIDISGSVTIIGAYAFQNCAFLTSVTIGDSVEDIWTYAFSGCALLTTLTIPDSVTFIGDNAFDGEFKGIDGRSKLEPTAINLAGSTFKKIDDNWFKIYSGQCGEKVYYEFDSSSGKLTITGSGSMYDYTNPISSPWFSYKKYIRSIDIGDTVTTIGRSAFSSCSSLTSVNIPASVITIGDNAFSDCTTLAAISVDPHNTKYSSVNGVLFNKEMTELVQYPIAKTDTTYSIPGTVTSIGKYAFYHCSSLTSVTIPDSVTIIGKYAFSNCTALSSANLGGSVLSVGESAFSQCTSLTSITFPGFVRFIGDHAFDGKFYDTDNQSELQTENLAGFTFTKIGDNWVKYVSTDTSDSSSTDTSDSSHTDTPVPDPTPDTTPSVTPSVVPSDNNSDKGSNTSIYLIVGIVAILAVLGAVVFVKKRRA